jgi:hypothetical protein
MSKLRTGVLGVFPHLDTTTAAIRRLRREGFELTVYSPTPRHEVEEALGTKESPVRIFTLVGAFTGTAAGTALATWASIDWPLVVGGKEIIALPAFSVIMFELTILLGALSTVAGLFILGRIPHLGPAEAPMYHPSFTSGNFGVFAHAPRDRYGDVQRIMTESGSEEVLVDQR